MAITYEWNLMCELGYLDLGCSNHMIGHKKWLTSFYSSKKTNVKLENSNYIAIKIICDIVNKRKYGENEFVKKVLYVHGMMCNLLSIEKLVENGFQFSWMAMHCDYMIHIRSWY